MGRVSVLVGSLRPAYVSKTRDVGRLFLSSAAEVSDMVDRGIQAVHEAMAQRVGN